MGNPMIAPCGLDCSQCEAYLVTQANDEAGKEALMVKWCMTYNVPHLTTQDVTCDGCLSAGRHGGHCAECEIRDCILGKNLTSCVDCEQYVCEKLQAVFQSFPAARTNLELSR